jgi:glycosyltransferase involved in cell wall biosynthesis
MTGYSTALFERLLPGSRPAEVGAGVDPGEFTKAGASGERFRAKYGLGDGPLILYVGRKEPAKRYDLAAVALAGVPEARLVLVGQDVDGRPITQPNARVLGALPRADVLDAYDACQAVIFPSESESFGLVLLEAWLARKPVIGNAACGPVAALIDDGVDGFVCAGAAEMAQRARQLLADPGLRQRLGEAGYHKVITRYTWDQVSRRVLDVYEQLTAPAAVELAYGPGRRA